MRKYGEEFKREAVRLIQDGQSVASVARQLAIAESLLHNSGSGERSRPIPRDILSASSALRRATHRGTPEGRRSSSRSLCGADADETAELAARRPRSFVPRTTDSRHGVAPSANLLLDARNASRRPREVIVGDITHHLLPIIWLSPAALDLHGVKAGGK